MCLLIKYMIAFNLLLSPEYTYHTGQKFILMQPKFPSTFSACYTSKISLAMPIYDQKLKSTKDFG